MAATEPPEPTQEKPEATDSDAKTVFNLLSKLKESSDSTNKSDAFVSETTLQLEADNDILLLRRDPETNQSTINKSAYLKLHKSLSPNKSSTVDRIKERYEKTNDDDAHHPSESETVESLKNKYSPAGLGYTKPQPAPKPRLSKSQIIITPVKRTQARLSLNIEKNKQKDVNSNHLVKSIVSKEDISSEEDEFVTIITRSDSEESVLKFQKELSAFTMDKKKRANSFRKIFSVFSNKDKKKKQEDKKKPQNGEKYSDNNYQNEISINNSSFSRQSPYRHTTGGGEAKSIKSNANNLLQRSDSSDVKVPNQYNEQQLLLERDYAQMHINPFNQYKQNFVDSTSKTTANDGGYTPMDKPIIIYKNNDALNNTATTYMNMPNIRKYIDTSSSASTLESDRSNIYQNEALGHHQPKEEEVEIRTYPTNSFRPSRISDGRRDTPPRLMETQQDVRLVNPKALIPINSERPLPNPYHQNSSSSRESPVSSSIISRSKPPTELQKFSEVDPRPSPRRSPRPSPRRPYLEEAYGTVLDSLESRHRSMRKHDNNERPPRSPSVEPTKLRLPPNREIVPLSPRIKSPIPPENVSTEKLIATELLKPKRSPTPTKRGAREEIPQNSHKRLEIDIDYPDNVNNNYANSRDSLRRSADNLLSTKPPVSTKPSQLLRRPPESLNDESLRMSQASTRSSNESVVLRHRASPINVSITNVQVHNSPALIRTPSTPNNSLSNPNLSSNNNLSPLRPTNLNIIRPSTPSGSQMIPPESSPKTTPQKEDMRKSVEAYYWKEIRKLKDQEDYELYLLQRQYGPNMLLPYGYAEDPISVRRSRSMSPLANRNGRRSLSLPRESRPPTINVIPENYYPNPIPENRAVTNQMHQQPRSVQQLQFQQQQQQYFQRNTPERSTIDGSPSRKQQYDGNNTNSLYRPIFKRGSLSMPPRQLMDDTLKRKVSFSGTHHQDQAAVQSWPTRNGFTQSPPQRRMDKLQSPDAGDDDEVFYPNTPNDNRYRTNSMRHDLPNEEMYYNTKQNNTIVGTNANATTYVLRANQNSLYLHHHQRQPIENPYGPRRLPNSQQEEMLYGQPIDAVSVRAPQVLTRHGSIQIQEELYGQRPPGPRRLSYQNTNLIRPSVPPSTPVRAEVQYVQRRPASQQAGGVPLLRREVIVNDEIFGQFGGYAGPNNNVRVVTPKPQNVYASRQSIADYNSRVRDEYYNRHQPHQKQVSVSNKVCDIYGQIHDSEPSKVPQQSGVLMGQLHPNPNSAGSPAVVRGSGSSSYSQLIPAGRDNFVRNSRLTSSANDMYRRAQNVPNNEALYGIIEQQQQINGAPTRPLPPVPQKRGVVRNNMVSDTESGSDASEIQRILNNSNNSKSKKRGIFGK